MLQFQRKVLYILDFPRTLNERFLWQKKIIYLSHFLPKSHKIYNIISMNYRYIRVSTDKQTVENQRYEITEFAQKNGIQIDEWIEETISGTLEPNRRQQGTLLERIQKDI